MILTLASVGLPTTSGFTGEFLVLLGAFRAAWPLHAAGDELPLVLAVVAVAGVVLGALYMLRFALGFLFGARAGAAPAVRRPGPAREGDPRPDRRRRVRARPVSRTSRWARPSWRRRPIGSSSTTSRLPGGTAMNGQTVLTAMLPEHLLLLGIVARDRPRDRRARRARRARGRLRLRRRGGSRGAAPRRSTATPRRRSRGSSRSMPPTLLVKAMVLALALPVLLMARGELPDGEFRGAAAVVALRRLPAAVGGQLSDALPRPRADVAAGLRAGAARLPAPAERRSGAEVPGARRHRDRDAS